MSKTKESEPEVLTLYNPCLGEEIEVVGARVQRGVLLDMEATYRCEACGQDHTVVVKGPDET
ncbi:hypothetical protein FV139_20585 [Parahaliea maris]|uniref:Uncharacterized protein n=1 Tax=Parahaliea maris TaxID=2716870 RepID=A0A5C8ZKW1_9GAMM|nr:hypothetical protein [Parahaliea maris]TXS89078.1 hypothetical protein FV139_20585 [Parahaliea maris]